METSSPELTGLVLVDKPAGMTSHDGVAIVRRALKTRRVGHTGTLDPFATGLLVVLVGRGTRLIPYIDGEPKVYEATIRFGAETDTDDVTGEVVREAPPPSDVAIAEAIVRLTGEIDQIPPAYSAKKIDGVRAYDAARRGAALALAPSRVSVREWTPLGRDDRDFRVRITCGEGTYVRALARDLGRLTHSAAHLSALRRVASGAFHVRDASTLDEVREGRAPVLAPRAALPDLPAESLSAAEINRVAQGNPVEAHVAGDRAAIVAEDGALVAYAERRGDRWQPRVVMRRA